MIALHGWRAVSPGDIIENDHGLVIRVNACHQEGEITIIPTERSCI